jgi:tetratricopeptide (TPR) repeat protein
MAVEYNVGALIVSAGGTQGVPFLEESIALANRVLAKDPGCTSALQVKGHALYRLGRCSEAIPFLEEALQKIPDNQDLKTDLEKARREADY